MRFTTEIVKPCRTVYHIHAAFSYDRKLAGVDRAEHPPMEKPPLVNMDHGEVTSGVRILGRSQVSN